MTDRLSPWARQAIAAVRARSHGGPIDDTLRVTVNFHPDDVLAAVADDGHYRSQFATGTSGGALGVTSDDQRWQWERRIFGGAYDDGPPEQRPVYGALNHRRREVGAAIRFGSAHLRLAQHVLERTTFCFPDSVLQPEHFGTSDRFDLARLADAFAAESRTDAEEQTLGGLLDDYVEAHVHGTVRIATDAEAVVLDPCYRSTPVEDAAHRLEIPVEWHTGRRLAVDELRRHPDFRGVEIVALGERIAVDDMLDARIVAGARHDTDPLQLKLLWHLVARFGD